VGWHGISALAPANIKKVERWLPAGVPQSKPPELSGVEKGLIVLCITPGNVGADSEASSGSDIETSEEADEGGGGEEGSRGQRHAPGMGGARRVGSKPVAKPGPKGKSSKVLPRSDRTPAPAQLRKRRYSALEQVGTTF
jgi:hypothetical protein